MGIPSYYKKLIEFNPLLLQSVIPDGIEWLFMDFNCLIYHCLSSPTLPPYPVHGTPVAHDEWEDALIGEVVAYTTGLLRTIAPLRGAYLAIDGVVPMAKMRQQRLRRFKSSWLVRKGWSERSVAWDTNAITPGTRFMSRLRIGLEGMITREEKQAQWTLSSADEAGEGEHKILRAWRTRQYSGTMAVYGMDADLIVLSLLTAEMVNELGDIWLFREATAPAVAVATAMAAEWEWFSVTELRRILCQQAGVEEEREWILTYGCAMSLLGNDFLPRSLTFTLRDDGHAELISHLRELQREGHRLLGSDGALCSSGWMAFFARLAETESQRMYDALKRKRRLAQMATETEMGQRNWPLSQYEEEYSLVSPSPPYELQESWKERYGTMFFPGWRVADQHQICAEYVTGLRWIWSYYLTGIDSVCYQWYYPHSLPPLWSWLASLQDRGGDAWTQPMPVRVSAAEIRPAEQLAVVLPLSSWSLIPAEEKQLRSFPVRAPYYFPTEFTLDSVGKRFFWECEPIIPIPSLMELRAAVLLP